MRVQYCSDLHLEFPDNNTYLRNNPIKISGDVLILAGDIALLTGDYLNDPFINFISSRYKEVFWLPGNHEFYYKNINDFNKVIEIKIRENVRVINNSCFILDDVRFVFSTLWSRISTDKRFKIEQGVSDFHCIEKNGRKFNASDFNELHDFGLNFLYKTLETKYPRTVVVTHHVPSIQCNSLAHKKSPLNDAFCVDLTDFIKECGANFWVYGHSHHNMKPLYIGDTILLTNQLGYVHINEHKSFRENAYFSL